VRKTVGYMRFDTEEERQIISELYRWSILYYNFFQAMRSLKKNKVSAVR
jgi:hypothetical protein